MPSPIKVLILEDNPADAELVVRELRRAGFDATWQRVDTEPEYLEQLTTSPDLIISDFQMPQFNGLRALELLNERKLDIPFIIVSGSIGEDIAVAAMKQGATDYLLKDRLARLGLAVSHALEQNRLRRESRQTTEALKLFRALVDRSNDAFEIVDPLTGRFLDVNERGCSSLGYTRDEFLALRVFDIDSTITPENWPQVTQKARDEGSIRVEGQHRRKDGTTFPVEVNVRWVQLDRAYLVAVVRDVTDRRQAEDEIQSQVRELQRWHEATLGREERILEIKREVNELLTQLKQPPRYTDSFPS